MVGVSGGEIECGPINSNLNEMVGNATRDLFNVRVLFDNISPSCDIRPRSPCGGYE
jgi:hypothetical protein